MGLKLNAQSEAFGLKDVNGRTGLTKHRLNHDLSGLIARSSVFPTFTQDVEFYPPAAFWNLSLNWDNHPVAGGRL